MAGFSGIWPLAGGEDMQTIQSALGELKIAYEERFNLLSMLTGGGAGYDVRGTDYANGDEMQWAGIDQRSFGGFLYRFGPAAAQMWIEGSGFIASHFGSFIDTSLTIEGNGTEALTTTYASIAAFRTAAGLNASGFTRKYWKETTSNLASGFFYSDGNSPVNGDRYLAGDGLVYDFTAGSRVLVGGCYGTVQPDTVTAFGIMQAGDFVYDHEVLNELHRCFKIMKRLPLTIGGDTNTDHEGAEFVAVSYAAMKATSEANYNINAHNGLGVLVSWGGATESNYSPGTSWGGSVSGIRQRLAGTVSTVTVFAGDVEFYGYAKAAQSTSGGVWDANGQGMLQDQWHGFSSAAGVTSAATAYSSFLGFDNTVGIPVWAPDASVGYVGPGVRNLYRGFDVTSSMATIDYGVAGGFDKY